MELPDHAAKAKSKDQHVQDELYNLDDIQAGKVPDPLLKGGDIVVVEQSGVKVAWKDVGALLPLPLECVGMCGDLGGLVCIDSGAQCHRGSVVTDDRWQP
jgi:hypothetical protein